MLLIDSHCHLDFSVFDEDRKQLIQQAHEHGVEHIIVPSVARNNWKAVREIKRQYPGVDVAYGLHPLFMHQHKQSDINSLRVFVNQNRPIAIGECGLDFYIEGSDQESQLSIFIEQLKIANEFSLPVIIHARKSLDIVLKQLRKFTSVRGIIHSFSGSQQQAEQCIQQGFLLGFGGPVTYTRASKLRKLVTWLPLESLVLETDAPDQPDSQHTGLRNVPANLVQIAEVIAALRGIEVTEVAKVTTHNAKQLFSLNE